MRSSDTELVPELSFQWAPGLDACASRARGDVRGVVVHRIEVSQEDPSFADTPAEIARFFCEHPMGLRATGGQMPYSVLVAPDGGLTQCVPLGLVTPHARSHNPTTIGVGCIGDFRARPLAPAQQQSLVALCAGLLGELGLSSAALHGHDELAEASSDPNKECPGRMLSMNELRQSVARLMGDTAVRLELAW